MRYDYVEVPATQVLRHFYYYYCRAYIRSELKGTSEENIVCMFLIWTILQMEMGSAFKKNE